VDKPLELLLGRAGAVGPDALAAAAAGAQRHGTSLVEQLVASGAITEDLLADTLEQSLHVPRLHLAKVPADPDALGRISERLARRHLLLPLRIEGGALVTAMVNPTDLTAIQDVEFASSLSVKPVVATPTEIEDAIRRYYAPEETLSEFVSHVADVQDFTIVRYPETGVDGQPTIASTENSPVVKLCSLMLYDAARTGASDVHVEPALHDVHIRMRVDGVLRPYTTFPKWLHDAVVSRLKILARLDIAERRVPQDGRIKVAYREDTIDVRVSTLPTHFGEKVVMRLLGSGVLPTLSSLRLPDEQRAIVERVLAAPQGLILDTGPTGAGKTTTLYAMLTARRSPELNIVTIEDPVEYQLADVTQVQVNVKAGLTFASALRSILRQDPDVVLLGEIRDAETAEIAFHAAMTGHLVLTTLHTNSSVATIGRLFELGVDPLLLTSSVNAIVAQRLLRRVCEHCKGPYTPSAEVLAQLKLTAEDGPFFRGRGCARCGETGYAGRQGIYELLVLTPRLKTLIHQRPSDTELRRAAAREGTRFLAEAAIDAARKGITTVEEVQRVVQIEADDSARCPQCRAIVEADFATCPFCLTRLVRTCPSCRQELKPEWKGCPYCHAEALAAPPPQRLLPPSHESEPPPKRVRILVVDDDPVMQLAIRGALSELPIPLDLRTADDGVAALEQVEREVPDALILDVKMPRLDGFSVCERLRQDVRTAFVPILMLTTSGDDDNRTHGYLVGTDDYMTKPFSARELQARLGRLLRRTYGI
jgi:type IV pilus assembly protein PilB